MDLLSGSDSDSEKKDNGFKINKSYAKSYEKFRKREEKQRLTDKYGDPDASDSEEEEIRSTPALDKEWLRAFAVVRFNQPRLYSGEKLFHEEVKPVPKKTEEKKFTLKDQERKFLLEKGGVVNDEDEDDITRQKAGPSYFEEQEEIKKSLKKAIGDFDDDSDDNEDSLLVVKEKTKNEEKEEENDYISWLKGEKQELADKEASKELAPLKAYWSNPDLNHKEKVLRDYILNNGYMDQEGKGDDSSEDEDDEDVDLSEDEEFLDKADKYERTYNFRHEEPGGFEIKSYPRVIETSVRAKQENKRAERRKKLAEKKQREKEERMEEMKMLQKLQREEKQEKLLKLQELSENPDIMRYLETDFDPEEHDKLMQKQYDDEYYQNEGDEEKPVFEQDEEMGDEPYGDDTDEWWHEREQAHVKDDVLENEGEGEEEELYADDPGFVMDADYDPDTAVSKNKKERKKSKKNKKSEKAQFDPTTKTFDEYLDEYLKDKINRLPFTYRDVVPNDFGLSTDEILSAPDKELNAWVSVKRMSQYRTQDSEMYDLKKYQRKAKSQYKKHQVIPSLDPKQRTQETSDIVRPKTPKKKKEKKEKQSGNEESISSQKQQKKKKKQKEAIVKPESESPEEGTGTSPERKKRKKQKRQDESVVNTEVESKDNSPKPNKKRNKKERLHNGYEEGIVQNEPDNSNSDPGVSPKQKKVDNSISAMISPKRLKGEMSEDNQKTKSSKKSKKRKRDLEAHTDCVSTSRHEEKSGKKIKLEQSETTELNKKKKSKKLKNIGNDSGGKGGNMAVEHNNKKYRRNFSDLRVDKSDSTNSRPAGTDKKEVNRNLRMVMSKSRLSSYGLKKGSKKKKKDSQPQD